MPRLFIALALSLLALAPAQARHKSANPPPPPAPAQPALRDTPPAEERYLAYTADVPACDDPAALAWIVRDFADRESGYWSSPLQIDTFVEAHETGFRAAGLSFIPRRHCAGEARFNDGVARRLAFDIAEGTGFVGTTYGVTWCVVGLDRNHAFGRNCRLDDAR